MKTFFVFSLLLTFESARSQTGITVYYNQFRNGDTTQPHFEFMVAANDSTSYECISRMFRPYSSKNKIKVPLGKKFMAHSIFIHRKKNLVLTQANPGGMMPFLITDTLKTITWTESGEQKYIAGYFCKKVQGYDEQGLVEAWYAPSLPYASGPSEKGGLAGMILKVDSGPVMYKASRIDLSAPVISTPGKGKKVTKEEYQKLSSQRRSNEGNTP